MANESFQKVFNTGILTLTPSGTYPTPIKVATLKDVTLDIAYTVKELRGANTFAEDATVADGKISGKAKSGRIYGAILQAVCGGMTSATGQSAGVYDERFTIPSTPYIVTAANSATWTVDQGVIDINTGLAMVRVASAPTTGQYAVTAGSYTFAAADTGHVVSLSYAYTLAGGITLSLANSLMGASTNKFALHCFNNYDGAASGWKLYSVIFPKLAIAYKAGDYAETDLDFSAFCDSTGKMMEFFKA